MIKTMYMKHIKLDEKKTRFPVNLIHVGILVNGLCALPAWADLRRGISGMCPYWLWSTPLI